MFFATALPQRCHSVVTALSQICDNAVTTLSQICDNDFKIVVTALSQILSNVFLMTTLWQLCDNVVTALSQICDNVVTALSQGCHRVVKINIKLQNIPKTKLQLLDNIATVWQFHCCFQRFGTYSYSKLQRAHECVDRLPLCQHERVGGFPPWTTIVGGIPPWQHEWVGGVPPWKTIVGGIPPEHYLVVFVLCSSLLLSFMISSMLFPSTVNQGQACRIRVSAWIWRSLVSTCRGSTMMRI